MSGIELRAVLDAIELGEVSGLDHRRVKALRDHLVVSRDFEGPGSLYHYGASLRIVQCEDLLMRRPWARR